MTIAVQSISEPRQAVPCAGTLEATRRFVAELIAQAEGNPRERDATGVLLDVKVDGVRCVVVRHRRRAKGHPDVMLSPRELEVARLAALGHPNKIIAYLLNISSWTVSAHLRHIFAKLNVSSRTAMVSRLLEQGIGE